MGIQKTLLIGIGIAAVGYGLYKGLSLKEMAQNISISLLSLPRIHKINLTGLKISVDFKVDNPVKSRPTVRIPSVKLFYKGKQLASTAINDRTYTIEPVSTGKITGTIIEASYLNLLTTAPSIINDFTKQGSSLASNFGFEVLAEVNGIPLKVQKI